MNIDEFVYDLPLLELFNRLRQAGLPLGIDEYRLLIRALKGGFGIPNRINLARLCKTLWIKSADEERIFDYYFEQVTAQSNFTENTSQPLQPLLTEPEHTYKESLYNRIWYRILQIFKRIFQVRSAKKLLVANTSVPTSIPAMAAELTSRMEDEIQVAKAVSLATSKNEDIAYDYFIQTDEYFPITRRQMKQSWRYLRRPIREGPPAELDLEATVKEVGRQGMLLKPVLVPYRINRAELLLLIDQDGSMVPFHALSRRLSETALRGGRLGRTDIYYFHNCPVEYLYHDSAHQKAETIQDILYRLYYRRTGILIFSDAGSARGGFSSERVSTTMEFLDKLRQKVRYIVWLNPMPRSRWHGTTAEELMHLVPMFDVSRRGLDDAISVLHGRSAPYLHREVRAL